MSRKRARVPPLRQSEDRDGAPRQRDAVTEAWFVRRSGALEVRVRVVPRASRQRIAGLLGDRIKVQIHAAPVEGEANRALGALLAEVAGLPVSSVRVVAGAKDRSKSVLLECAEPEAVLVRLRAALVGASAAVGAGRPAR